MYGTAMIRMRTTSRLALALVFSAILCCAGRLHGSMGGNDAKELQIKAAILLNFVRFTTWPENSFASAEAPLVLAVVGDDPFGSVLEQTFNQPINGRPVQVRRLPAPRRGDHVSSEQHEAALAEMRRQVQQCHAVYLTGCEPAFVQSVLEQVDTSALLTIGDERECAERATALALDRDGGRIVFCANISVIERSKLKISSKLLRLARVIEGDSKKSASLSVEDQVDAGRGDEIANALVALARVAGDES
jgi:hypothetical protein